MSEVAKVLRATNAVTGELIAVANIMQYSDPINPLVDHDQVFDMCLTSYRKRDYTWNKEYDCGNFGEWVTAMLSEQGIGADEIYFLGGRWLTCEQALELDADFDPYGEETLYDLCEYGDDSAIRYAWDAHLSKVLTAYGVREWGYEYTLTTDLENGIGIMWATNEKIESEGITDAQGCATAELHDFSCYAHGDVYGYQIKIPCDKCGALHDTEESCWGFFGMDNATEETTRELKRFASGLAKGIEIKITEA